VQSEEDGEEEEDDYEGDEDEEEEEGGLTEGTASSPPSTPGGFEHPLGPSAAFWGYNGKEPTGGGGGGGGGVRTAKAPKAWSWDRLPGPKYEAMNLNKARAKALKAAAGTAEARGEAEPTLAEKDPAAVQRKRLFFFPTDQVRSGLDSTLLSRCVVVLFEKMDEG
jgi:hypothetical protein